jgi:Photosynthesis system II assembly factor YCF48
MPELTTILKQRLGAMEEADPKVHPDPDTLTAFVEELLPAAEHNTVLEHISLCTQCREVVALTLPERAVAAEAEEAPAPVSTALPAPRRWWFLTPQFGMVASIAAVAAGVFLVLKIPQMQKPQTQAPVETASVTLKQDAPVPPAASTLQDNVGADRAVVPQPESPAARTRSLPGAPAGVPQERDTLTALAAAPAKKSLASPQNQPLVTRASGPSDYVNSQVFAAQLFAVDAVAAVAQEPPAAPSPARASFAFNRQGFVNQNGSGTLSNAFLVPPSAAGRNQGTISVYPLPGSDHGSLLSKVTVIGRQLHLKRQIPSISAESANNYAMFSPGLGKSEAAEMAAKPADSGAASELGQSAAFSANGLRGRPSALDMGANSFLWKVVQGKLLRSSDMEHWLDGYPASDGIEFTVVTASGADVWAGGKDAALVHSRDGGITWDRITLGASATGSVTGIEVNRATVRVRSSSGQGWMSQDGGRSWVMQD